jgi:hypothetical protein
MKRILFFLFAVLTAQFADAQSVGIGTATPNARAALEINSTTKGLLIPSMTTSQRLAIASPPNGLMVYDTERNSFYHYTGTTWSAILNGDYWIRPVASRSRISNPNDSVGIGTNLPTELLDVDGNIRSRNNIRADNDIRATGDVIAGNLVTTGNLLASGVSTLSGNVTTNSNLSVGGTSLLDGNVTTNSDLSINNTNAILQLKSNNVNSGFFQLSGSNVRLGTNSGNAVGSLIIRMNGNDRVQIDPSGDINIEGKITKTAVTGFRNLLPLCYGTVKNSVLKSGTANVTVNYVPINQYDGYYTISCPGINENSVITATCNNPFLNDGGNNDNVIVGINASYYSPGVARVTLITYLSAPREVHIEEMDFSFMIY